MKKLIRGTLITLIAVFAIFGASVTALAASGYVNWNGTSAYQNILITLEQITNRGQELKTERDNSNRSNEQLLNQIKDRENVIKDKENQLEAKQKEIDNLKNSATNNTDQLKQAETDMKDIDAKSKELLNSLK